MGMTQRSFEKKRGRPTRKRNPVLLLSVEGNNKTEKVYFSQFRAQKQGSFRIEFASGSETDPAGMLASLKKDYKKLELSKENDDIACVVLDLDCDAKKASLIQSLSQQKDNSAYLFIVSNPCFEVWFLLHFVFSTKSYLNQNQVLEELRQSDRIPHYKKNSDIAAVLQKYQTNAIHNGNRLKAYHESQHKVWPSTDCNPATDVVMLVEKILEKLNRS